MNHWRHIVAVFLLISAAVTGLQLSWHEPESLSQAPLQAPEPPDLVITQPVLDTFDEQGKHARRLVGTRLEHFEQDGQSRIFQPQLNFTQQQEGKDPVPWQLQADQAITQQGSDKIDLQGHVVLSSDATTGGRTEILTDTLLVDTGQQLASTDAAVTIRAQGSEAHSSGMQANLARETLRLNGVRESHKPARR